MFTLLWWSDGAGVHRKSTRTTRNMNRLDMQGCVASQKIYCVGILGRRSGACKDPSSLFQVAPKKLASSPGHTQLFYVCWRKAGVTCIIRLMTFITVSTVHKSSLLV